VYFALVAICCGAGYFIYQSKWWMVGTFIAVIASYVANLNLENKVKDLKEKVERLEKEGEQK
jgi:hypothetical protein